MHRLMGLAGDFYGLGSANLKNDRYSAAQSSLYRASITSKLLITLQLDNKSTIYTYHKVWYVYIEGIGYVESKSSFCTKR